MSRTTEHFDSMKMCAKNKHFPFTKQSNINQEKLRSSVAHMALAKHFQWLNEGSQFYHTTPFSFRFALADTVPHGARATTPATIASQNSISESELCLKAEERTRYASNLASEVEEEGSRLQEESTEREEGIGSISSPKWRASPPLASPSCSAARRVLRKGIS